MPSSPPVRSLAPLALALAAATVGNGAAAAGNSSLPRCTSDARGAETCRYPDGSTTRRWLDRAGVLTFRDRDGSVTKERGGAVRNTAAIEVRGKTVARCQFDRRGPALCRQ